MRSPCVVCKRMHRGRRCKPEDARAAQLNISMPAHIHRALVARVPWGERSGFVARAVESALEDT